MTVLGLNATSHLGQRPLRLPKSGLPESCPAELGFLAQTRTLAGLESLARKGVLYFNLHTRARTSYGEMRGQLYAVQP
ncbi:CHRD domain-containing protein [Corallococcus carmarthensis]|uniref:CHRD domain-containing protein n=1 Tax=Corallococcus carmarthensis TaxID=2316728 RepID=UPI001ABF997B|nr:CHRD domain-containing protein [Corallococcus carmarthensis]